MKKLCVILLLALGTAAGLAAVTGGATPRVAHAPHIDPYGGSSALV